MGSSPGAAEVDAFKQEGEGGEVDLVLAGAVRDVVEQAESPLLQLFRKDAVSVPVPEEDLYDVPSLPEEEVEVSALWVIVECGANVCGEPVEGGAEIDGLCCEEDAYAWRYQHGLTSQMAMRTARRLARGSMSSKATVCPEGQWI